MRNPFQYGGIVDGDHFCNREQEKADLLRAMENGEKLFVYSERRLGKTSLVQSVIQKLPSSYVAAYVDLWATDDEPSFAAAMAKAIAESMTYSSPQRPKQALFPRVGIEANREQRDRRSLKELSAMKMPRLDKTVVTFGALDDTPERRAYWHSRTPAERWVAIEQMRRINYGEHATTTRLQRLLEIAERK